MRGAKKPPVSHPGLSLAPLSSFDMVFFSSLLEIILTGKRIDAHEALRLGTVERAVPHEQLMEAVDALAQTILARARLAVESAKEAIVRGLELPLEEGLKMEPGLSMLLRGTEDRLEAKTPSAVQRALILPPQEDWRLRWNG